MQFKIFQKSFKTGKINTGIPHFIALCFSCFADVVDFFFFLNKLKVGGNPILSRASLEAQKVKNLPAMQEARVQSLSEKIPWRRQCQPTPVFLTGEFNGQRNLVGYSLKSQTWLSNKHYLKQASGCHFLQPLLTL